MELERHDEIAVLKIDEGRANAIGPPFLDALDAAMTRVGDARALVVTGAGTVFSAGLDLPSLIELDEATMQAFIRRFSDVMLRLFELPLPVVAAVNGHAVAGGCVLMLQADERIAADRDAKLGLNEVALGIGLPSLVMETLRFRVPASSLVPVALEGKLFSPREALALELVDRLASPEALLETAIARAKTLAALAPVAFAQAKAMLRGPTANAIRGERERDAARWTRTWTDPEAQRRLRATVARLTKR